MSETWEAYILELFDGLQVAGKNGGEKELNRYMSGWMDYTILPFTSSEQVEASRQLQGYEKEYLLKLLRAGETQVWAAVDLFGGEHGR
jgi:hypothetical protein